MDYRTMGDIFKGLAASGNHAMQNPIPMAACEADTRHMAMASQLGSYHALPADLWLFLAPVLTPWGMQLCRRPVILSLHCF